MSPGSLAPGRILKYIQSAKCGEEETILSEKVVIIGSGPAGWSAAIYAARANLNPLLFEGTVKPEMIPLGQLAFTTEVENYPGFPNGLTGPEMMASFKAQSQRFGTTILSEDVESVDLSKHPFEVKGKNHYNFVY